LGGKISLVEELVVNHGPNHCKTGLMNRPEYLINGVAKASREDSDAVNENCFAETTLLEDLLAKLCRHVRGKCGAISKI
jgi:hypothetical protein